MKVAARSQILRQIGLRGGFQLLDLIIWSLKATRPVMISSALIGGKSICKRKPLQDSLSGLNAVISTNDQGIAF